ncbi:MAG: hypothetical protein ACRD3Q_02215, partial [Terriglobales bacterium]
GEDLLSVGGGQKAGSVLDAQRLNCNELAAKFNWLHRVHGRDPGTNHYTRALVRRDDHGTSL